jgi:hypothetical protein
MRRPKLFDDCLCCPPQAYRTAAQHSKGVEALFSGDDLKKIDRANALRLLPRLRTA